MTLCVMSTHVSCVDVKDDVNARGVRDARSRVCAIGTYEHCEKKKTRSGDVAFALASDENVAVVAKVENLGGVFDVRFARESSRDDRVAMACASGVVVVARVVENVDGISIDDLGSTATTTKGSGLGMCTSVDWGLHGSFVAGADDGSFVVARERDGALAVAQTFERAHDLEIWTVAFDRSTEDVLYTGADDGAFKKWDARCSTRETCVVNAKSHSAGVTNIAPSPHDDWVVVTGSYDESVRAWDARAMHSPLSTCAVGGGAWRVRWHRSKRALVCAAMGGGAVLVDCENGESRAYHTYGEHGSIVYGADWLSDGRGDDVDALISCSFYDNEVRCWSAPSAACARGV